MIELKDYLHYYIGCDCIVDFSTYIGTKSVGVNYDKHNVSSIFDCTNRNIDIDQCWGVTVSNVNGFKYYNPTFKQESKLYTAFVKSTHIKPILRRLSDITDEDERTIHSLEKSFEDKKGYTQIEMWATLINKFRQLGYDVDQLIENNLAIDKKTLNT